MRALLHGIERRIAKRSSTRHPPFDVRLVHTFPLGNNRTVLFSPSMNVHAFSRGFIDYVVEVALSGRLLPVHIVLIDAIPLGNSGTVLMRCLVNLSTLIAMHRLKLEPLTAYIYLSPLEEISPSGISLAHLVSIAGPLTDSASVILRCILDVSALIAVHCLELILNLSFGGVRRQNRLKKETEPSLVS